MLAPTHSVFGLFLTLIILAIFGVQISLHWTILAFTVLGAILPDIDHPRSLIGRMFPFISNMLERKFGHRTFTHSFLGALFFIIIFALLIVLYNLMLFVIHLVFGITYYGLQESNYGLAYRWIAAFSIGYLSHLCLDMFNKQGSQLLWPNIGRDVIPKNIKYRLNSGAKAEVYIFLVLLALIFLALPLSKYGIGSSLRWMLATPESAISEYRDLKEHTNIEFKGIFKQTKEKVEGVAEILDVVNKQLIVLYNNKVYSLSSEGSSDIIASKVRVKYTNKPLIYKQVLFSNKTREELIEQISTASLVSGYVKLPRDMQVSIPAVDINQGGYDTLVQKGDRLLLNFASKADLEQLGLNEQFLLLQKQDVSDLETLSNNKKKIERELIKVRSQDDGLTELGRNLYGDKAKLAERENKIIEYETQLREIELKKQAIELRMKEHEFLYTGEVKIRE